MNKEKDSKMWSMPLTSKTYRYYAITQFINLEKTWNAYFKAIKSIDALASYISGEKFDERSLRKILSIGNEIAESFSKKAITRIIFALISSKDFSNAKTLLEWLDLYSNQSIPEADIENIPLSIEFADKLISFKKRKKK